MIRNGFWGLGIFLLLMIPHSIWASDFSENKGPLPVRNFNPIQLMFLAMPVEEAETLSLGRSQMRIELAESNVIISEEHPDPDVKAVLKFETFRFAFSFKHGITNRMEGGIEIPVLYRDKGILDPFIISVESAVSRFSPNRLEFGRGSYGGYSIQRNGETLVSGDRWEYGLGDVVLHSKFLAWHESPGWPAVSFRGAVKLPTGSKRKLYGSGKVDFGMGLALQKRLNTRWVFYFNQGLVFPMGRFLYTGFTLNPISTTVLSMEWLWSSKFSWLTQIDFYTSPFHGTGVRALDFGANEVALGFDYALRPHVLWQLFGIENFNKPYLGSAADFTLLTTMSYRF
ncbi:MAG: DUF3187 family protein [Nitrospira sp.]|nr:DUF3187 family protein [Nitrospira sp.]